jgi:ADP-ribose pyrophosphatase
MSAEDGGGVAELTGLQRVFDGRYKLDEAVFSYDSVSGRGRVANVRRLIFERGDTAAALVHDTERDEIILCRQFRIATWRKGPGYMIEIAAGSLEGDEDPEDCIRREMIEEIGYQAQTLEPICRVYLSPGASSERCSLFYAAVRTGDLIRPEAAGLIEEGEDIARLHVPAELFLRNLDAGVYEDAKLVLAGYWLRARRGA